MESTDSNNEVKAWLISMMGKMIDVMILLKPGDRISEQVCGEDEARC